jgi:MYXO-CTERM domain-containing protein
MMSLLAVAAAAAFAQNDMTQANSYDSAWVSGWVAHCRTIYGGGTGKTAGFVLQIGDSITHANPYSQWPRGGAGQTAGAGRDQDTCSWSNAASWGSGNFDTTNKNGWYLAAADTSSDRGMTASGGIDAGNYATGSGNGDPTSMPSDPTQAGAAQKVADGTTWVYNLNIATVASAFLDAQFAVVMLGTNDAKHARTPQAFLTDLTTLVTTLEGTGIVVILSTVPPSTQFDVTPFNAQIRAFAQSQGLPLIDYYLEILARQPTSWQTTLISTDGIHPSGGNSAADPYTPGGNPSADQTGTNAANDGYLLRSWLTIQKLKEVKSYVADGVNPSSSPAPSPAPAPASSGSGSGGGGSSHCGCGSAAPGFPGWMLGAAGMLGLLAIRRR